MNLLQFPEPAIVMFREPIFRLKICIKGGGEVFKSQYRMDKF